MDLDNLYLSLLLQCFLLHILWLTPLPLIKLKYFVSNTNSAWQKKKEKKKRNKLPFRKKSAFKKWILFGVLGKLPVRVYPNEIIFLIYINNHLVFNSALNIFFHSHSIYIYFILKLCSYNADHHWALFSICKITHSIISYFFAISTLAPHLSLHASYLEAIGLHLIGNFSTISSAIVSVVQILLRN